MMVKMKFIYKSKNKRSFWIIIRVILQVKRVYSQTFFVYACEHNLFISFKNVLKMCSLASKSAKNVFFYTIVILRAFVSIRSLNMIWMENQLIICSFSLIKCTILILFFSQVISLKYKRRLSVFIISMENLNLFEFGNSIRPMDLLWCRYYFLPKDIPVKRIRFNMIDCSFFWRLGSCSTPWRHCLIKEFVVDL